MKSPSRSLPAPRRPRFVVYSIACADGSRYIGQTADLERRWHQHQAGQVRWTQLRRPLSLDFSEECSSRQEVVARERTLKTGFGRQWLKRRGAAGRREGGKTVGAGVITGIVK